jgi:electron-transferring-flavoprotein dehydrogenase
MEHIERESMEFDVVIVGAGPAGLSSAIKIRQLAIEHNLPDLSVCVVEKGSEVGAHILSGAVLEPRAINELFPNWKEEGAPLNVPVTEDKTYFLLSDEKSQEAPHWMVPKTMHNDGNYVISLGNVVRWLGQKAEELEVSIFPGFAALKFCIMKMVLSKVFKQVTWALVKMVSQRITLRQVMNSMPNTLCLQKAAVVI